MKNLVVFCGSKAVSIARRRCQWAKQDRWIGETGPSVPWNWHESFVEHIASVVRPNVYVELGLSHCVLFNRVVPYAQQLIGVDSDPDAGKWMSRSDKVRFVNSTTDEFAATLKSEPISIDLLFIDADHSRTAVLRDFKNFFPFVSEQGLILMHDTYPESAKYTEPDHCADAYKAAEELRENQNGFEIMTIPVHPGLTLCRKRNSQLPWKELCIAFEPSM